MTIREARKQLPMSLRCLAPDALTVIALRDAVMQELNMAKDGTNPLTEQQIDAFRRFLQKTC